MSELPEVGDMFSCGTCSKLPCVCLSKPTPPPDAQAMARKQVEERMKWYGENFVLYRTRWANELLAHDAAQREAIWRLEQQIEMLKGCLEENRKHADQLQARLTASEAELAELAGALDRVFRHCPKPDGSWDHAVWCNSSGAYETGAAGVTCNCKIMGKVSNKWTTVRPTVAGWYWWRCSYSTDRGILKYITRIYEIEDSAGGVFISGIGTPDKLGNGEWQGPLTPGEE